MRRIIGYIRFAWAILESLMVSATTWLNKFSKDYRHVSKCLAKEKLVLKVSLHVILSFFAYDEKSIISVLFCDKNIGCLRRIILLLFIFLFKGART